MGIVEQTSKFRNPAAVFLVCCALLLAGYFISGCESRDEVAVTWGLAEDTTGNTQRHLNDLWLKNHDKRLQTDFKTAHTPKHANSVSADRHLLLDEWMLLLESGQPPSPVSISNFIRQQNIPPGDVIAAIGSFLDLTNSTEPQHHELRLALLELLFGYEGHEVEDVAIDVLLSSKHSEEISLSGFYLLRLQPAVYAEAIRLVAEQHLIMSNGGPFVSGSLFELLGMVGTESTAAILRDLPIQYQAYANVALALIPDGSGISFLESQARSLAGGPLTLQGRLALELLAQEAVLQDAAADVLIDLAGQARIPDELWPEIVDLLAGNRRITLAEPAMGGGRATTIYRPEGNQVIFRTRVPVQPASYELLERRYQLIAQLQQSAPQELAPFFNAAVNRLRQLMSGIPAFSSNTWQSECAITGCNLRGSSEIGRRAS